VKDHREVEIAYDAIGQYRGGPPPSEVWELAMDKRYVSEFLAGEVTLDELSDSLDELQDTLGKLGALRKRRRTGKEEPTNYRRWALNEIFATEASQSEDVISFRSEWLNQGLLDLSEVLGWVAHRKATEGPPSKWITVLADENGHPVPEYDSAPGWSRSVRFLHYVDPDSEWIRLESVNAFGALYELAMVAKGLGRMYDWSDAWAATFVLTGISPPPEIAILTANESWHWPRARRRLTITTRLDTKPKELTDLYRNERRALLGDEPLPRAIGELSAKLAVFGAKHSAGYTWAEAMRLWNSKNEEHQFDSEARFTRDSRDAFKRVTGEELFWVGKSDYRRK
jgi:hypothetical protein